MFICVQVLSLCFPDCSRRFADCWSTTAADVIRGLLDIFAGLSHTHTHTSLMKLGEVNFG